MSTPKAADHLVGGSFGAALPLMEGLEPRMLLSAVDGSDAVQAFHAQDALFAENAGQWDDDQVHFGYSSNGAQIAFTDDSIDFLLTQSLAAGEEDDVDVLSAELSLTFDGAQAVTPTGADQAETIFNYHLGDQAQWVDGVRTFKTVVYEDLYAGIDLHTFSRHGQMKYEFHVDPGSDYQQIQLSYAGIEGLRIAADGSLHAETALGEIVDEGLYIYQEIDGVRVAVAGVFDVVDSNTYTFRVTGEYDPDVALVIDPDLSWSTYIGGTGLDEGAGIAADSSGGVYVTGNAPAATWPIGGNDIIVAKLTSAGGHEWSTFLGGVGNDYGKGIAVDGSGAVYVTGWTGSPEWASDGFDTSHNGFLDAFVVKLNAAGGHVWSTYMGGSGEDGGNGIAVDASGVYVTGHSGSSGWALGGFDTSYNGGGYDVFVAKLTSAGGHTWSTYMGGEDSDFGYGIATHSAGGVYVTGESDSADWVSGGFDLSHNGNEDAFVASLSAAGAHVWSTYLGGSGTDSGRGVAADASANVYVTGYTDSVGWAAGGFDISHNGNEDIFVARLAAGGGHTWSTYLGGSSQDQGRGIAIDSYGGIYVTGWTDSAGWASGGFDIVHNGDNDAFVARVTAAGAHVWSAYLGGGVDDRGEAVAVDDLGGVYLAGWTGSAGWAAGGYDTSHNGAYDIFVARVADGGPDWHFSVVGDFNGDGLDDIASRNASGNWFVGESTGSAFTRSYWGRWDPAKQWSNVRVGDFDNDGKDDIAGRNDNGSWFVSLSTGSNFSTTFWKRWPTSTSWRDVQVGDFNGDGMDDLIARNDNNSWFAGISNGTRFVSTFMKRWASSTNWHDIRAGDINGDGKTDLVGRNDAGSWFGSLATETRFQKVFLGRWKTDTTWTNVRVADFTGDGKDDIVGRNDGGSWYVGVSTGVRIQTQFWRFWQTTPALLTMTTGDFTGDGRADIQCRDITGEWYAGVSTANSSTRFAKDLWGSWSTSMPWRDVGVGDFNGDGKDDLVGRRSDENEWWVSLSTGSGLETSVWEDWPDGS